MLRKNNTLTLCGENVKLAFMDKLTTAAKVSLVLAALLGLTCSAILVRLEERDPTNHMFNSHGDEGALK